MVMVQERRGQTPLPPIILFSHQYLHTVSVK